MDQKGIHFGRHINTFTPSTGITITSAVIPPPPPPPPPFLSADCVIGFGSATDENIDNFGQPYLNHNAALAMKSTSPPLQHTQYAVQPSAPSVSLSSAVYGKCSMLSCYFHTDSVYAELDEIPWTRMTFSELSPHPSLWNIELAGAYYIG